MHSILRKLKNAVQICTAETPKVMLQVLKQETVIPGLLPKLKEDMFIGSAFSYFRFRKTVLPLLADSLAASKILQTIRLFSME